jgi:hypothetical protein
MGSSVRVTQGEYQFKEAAPRRPRTNSTYRLPRKCVCRIPPLGSDPAIQPPGNKNHAAALKNKYTKRHCGDRAEAITCIKGASAAELGSGDIV